jgi:hypothetical protein
MAENKLTQALEHVRLAYANTQEIIKFVDAKIGVLIGLITLTTAVPLLIFQWVAGRDSALIFSVQDFTRQSCLACELFIISGLVGTALGGLGVFFAMQGLIARQPPQHSRSVLDQTKDFWRAFTRKPKISFPRTTFLFPLHDPKDRTAANTFFPSLLDGLDLQQILDEYAFQVEQIGAILYLKVHYQRCAVRLLQIQLIAYIFSLGFSYLLLRW